MTIRKMDMGEEWISRTPLLDGIYALIGFVFFVKDDFCNITIA